MKNIPQYQQCEGVHNMALTKLKATRTEETREATSKNETYSFEENLKMFLKDFIVKAWH